MASEGRDWKGLYFFLTTGATLLFSVAYLASFLIFSRGISVAFYRAAMFCSMAAFFFRVSYSTSRPALSLEGVKMWLQTFVNTNNFQYVMFSFIFNGGTPVAVALLPICCCCLYQWTTYVNKHYAENAVWKRLGSKTFDTLQTNMPSALQVCATVEVSIAFFLIFELLTPARNPLRLVLYWNFLRLRFHCPDNTVLRIKFTYSNTAFYQRQVWTLIDSYTQPVFDRIPMIKPVVGVLKKWFRGY